MYLYDNKSHIHKYNFINIILYNKFIYNRKKKKKKSMIK